MKVCQEIRFLGKTFYKLETYIDCYYVQKIRRRAHIIFTPLNQHNVQSCPLYLTFMGPCIMIYFYSKQVSWVASSQLTCMTYT
jgi:hypothetical protein